MILHFADVFIPSTLGTFFGLYSSGVNLNHINKTLSLWDILACVSPFYGIECENSTGYPNKPFHGDVSINVPLKYVTGGNY